MSGHRSWRETREERLNAMTPGERAAALAAQGRAREELETMLDDFDGRSRPCRKRGEHTLKWGDCEHAVRPEPRLGFWRTFTASDGLPSIGQAAIPLAAVLPWAKHLTVDQRWQMLEEVSDADDPAAAVQHWYRKVIPALQAECEQREREGWDAFMRHEAAKCARNDEATPGSPE